MAFKTIDQLTDGGNIQNNDAIPIARNGEDYRVNVSNVLTKIDNLETLAGKNKGTFATLTELQTMYPTPSQEWYAYVTETTSQWRVNIGNIWYDTEQNIQVALNNKVDKVTGKQLSTEDYTAAEKNKLSNIQAGAGVNMQPDWNQTNNSLDDYIKNKPAIPDISTKQNINDNNLNTISKTVPGAINEINNQINSIGTIVTTAETASADNDFVLYSGISGKIIKKTTQAGFKTLLGLVKGDVGLANVANVDTTNASNISTGTLPDIRLSTNIVTANSTNTLTNKNLSDSLKYFYNF